MKALATLDNPRTIVIIGRAHSGTRILPEAMQGSGVYLGEPLNEASDLLPIDDIYAACRIFGDYVAYSGHHQWDFSRALSAPIPAIFVDHLSSYLRPLLESDASLRAWKIPNNNLIYPWLIRLLPEATFIHWVRHPAGSCATMTGVDRLTKWNIPARKYLVHEWNWKMRLDSWKYHADIVEQSPRPHRFLRVRFEDYVLRQAATKSLVEEKTGIPLQELTLHPDKAQTAHKRIKKYAFLQPALTAMGYYSQ